MFQKGGGTIMKNMKKLITITLIIVLCVVLY